MRAPLQSGRIADPTFLAGVVVASAALCVGRLGFYSDDWAFLSVLHLADDQSLLGLVGEQGRFHPSLRSRPTQATYQALLYRLFGLEPLGYHLVNLGVLVAVALLMYVVLRRARLPRLIAVAVPVVYALLPNYSTNHFWFAAFGYLLSVAFWIVALYGDLRAVESPRRLWAWKAVASFALLVAALGYEVVLPLFVLNVVLSEIHARRVGMIGLLHRVGPVGWVAFHGVTIATATAVAGFKSAAQRGVGVDSLAYQLTRITTGGLLTDFGTHGVGLPHTVWWSAPAAGTAGMLVALLVGGVVYAHLGRAAAQEACPWTGTAWARMAIGGLGVYILGYAIFLTTARVSFSGPGITNRVAAAAALGYAFILVAIAGWRGPNCPGRVSVNGAHARPSPAFAWPASS